LGELKEGTKHAIFKEIVIFSRGSQYTYVLSKPHELEEEIIILLKGYREAGQPLFASMIRCLIQKRTPHLLKNNSPNGFKVSIPWP
jgi:hypothetical protein